MAEIYRNSRSWRLRWLRLGFCGLFVGFVIGGLVIRAFDLDRGNDAESWFAVSLVFLGTEILLGLFSRRYVTRIAVGDAGLAVETLGLFRPGRHLLPTEALFDRNERHYNARGAVSTAVMLRAPGVRFPFVVDTTEDEVKPRPRMGRSRR